MFTRRDGRNAGAAGVVKRLYGERERVDVKLVKYYGNKVRNLKCPCGSGKKFKKCCMKQEKEND